MGLSPPMQGAVQLQGTAWAYAVDASSLGTMRGRVLTAMRHRPQVKGGGGALFAHQLCQTPRQEPAVGADRQDTLPGLVRTDEWLSNRAECETVSVFEVLSMDGIVFNVRNAVASIWRIE